IAREALPFLAAEEPARRQRTWPVRVVADEDDGRERGDAVFPAGAPRILGPGGDEPGDGQGELGAVFIEARISLADGEQELVGLVALELVGPVRPLRRKKRVNLRD